MYLSPWRQWSSHKAHWHLRKDVYWSLKDLVFVSGSSLSLVFEAFGVSDINIGCNSEFVTPYTTRILLYVRPKYMLHLVLINLNVIYTTTARRGRLRSLPFFATGSKKGIHVLKDLGPVRCLEVGDGCDKLRSTANTFG